MADENLGLHHMNVYWNILEKFGPFLLQRFQPETLTVRKF